MGVRKKGEGDGGNDDDGESSLQGGKEGSPLSPLTRLIPIRTQRILMVLFMSPYPHFTPPA